MVIEFFATEILGMPADMVASTFGTATVMTASVGTALKAAAEDTLEQRQAKKKKQAAVPVAEEQRGGGPEPGIGGVGADGGRPTEQVQVALPETRAPPQEASITQATSTPMHSIHFRSWILASIGGSTAVAFCSPSRSVSSTSRTGWAPRHFGTLAVFQSYMGPVHRCARHGPHLQAQSAPR